MSGEQKRTLWQLGSVWAIIFSMIVGGLLWGGETNGKIKEFDNHLKDSKEVMQDYNVLKSDIRSDLATIKQELKEINRRLEAIEKKQDKR